MSQFDQIRQRVPELRDASDEQILRDMAETVGVNGAQVARVFGYGQSGGMASNRIGAGVDNYQANLYGLGESVAQATGFPGLARTLGNRRQDNEFQAEVSLQRASDLGAVDDWREVDGVGSGLNYVGGLAAQSLPYMGEALVGGLAARGLMSGTRAALAGAKTLEEANAARKALNLGSMVGGAVASYPSAVGDILSNQRDENGQTNLGAALAGGVPYAALNAVGVEGVVARGLRPLTMGSDDLLKRVGVGAAKTSISEGASETGQELINQYAGRMAVNPEQTLFNEDASQRYLDSFVGGAALGGLFGGAAGVRRNSDESDLLRPEPEQTPLPPPAEPPPPQLGYDGRAGEYINFADGSSELRSVLEAQGDFPRRPPDPAVLAAQEAERARAEQTQAIRAKVEEVKQQALAQKQAEEQLVAERTARASELGVPLKGKLQVELFGQLEAALEQGSIDQDQFVSGLGLIAANQQGQVKKLLEAAPVMQQLVELRSTGKLNDAMFNEAEQQVKDGQLGSVRKLIAGANEFFGAAQGESNASSPAPANASPAPAPARAVAAAPNQQPGGAAPVAAVAPTQPGAPAELSSATVTVGRTGREQTLTKEQLRSKFAAATPLDRQRILDAMGMEQDADPTTGAPVFLQVAEPRTFDEVAELESQRTGKKVTKQAIAQALLKFGIREGTVDAATGTGTAADTVSEAELGIDPTSGGMEAAGMRVEGTASKATGQGLVEGGSETEAQRQLRAEGDEILKAAGPRADDTAPTNLPAGAVVTDLRDNNPGIQQRNIRLLLGHVEADNAAADWDGSTVPWETLPDTLKADWVTAYVWNLKANEGGLNFKELENEQANIERDFRAFRDNQVVQAHTRAGIAGNTRARSSAGVVERVEAPKPTVPTADAGSGKAAQKVTPAQSAWAQLRQLVPQMPEFASLTERQQKQVADLVAREQFNLAAANTVVGGAQQTELTPADQTQLKKLKTKLKRYEDLVACLKAG